jgi:hypothetical protein
MEKSFSPLFSIAADTDALNEDNPLECNYFVVCNSPLTLSLEGSLNNGLSCDCDEIFLHKK